MRSNEVVQGPGGWFLRVRTPWSTRLSRLPTPYPSEAAAQRALDEFNLVEHGTPLPNCKHEIPRVTCGLCAGMPADMSYAGTPANEHKGRGQTGPVAYDGKTGGFTVTVEQRLEDVQRHAEADKR